MECCRMEDRFEDRTESRAANRIEDVEYSEVEQYEAVVSILETLRYCSDPGHPLRMTEIYARCALFTTNWLAKKTMQRGMEAILEAAKNRAWVREHGGRVVKLPLGKNVNGYYWEKNAASRMLEKRLREKIRNHESEAMCVALLDKLGLNSDMKNEEKWRNAEAGRDRLDLAGYVAVRTPYTDLILEREYRMGYLQ